MRETGEFPKTGLAGRRSILVGCSTRDPAESREVLTECAALARTLRLSVLDTVTARAAEPHPATYLGSGKLAELRELGQRLRAEIFVFTADFHPVQQRNIEQALQAHVVDRTALILHIFAEHARTAEGKIQVELAQLSYLLPRLTGRGVELSRLGGGVGTRGPGEMKLEVMRRRIKERMHRLGGRIADIGKHREVLRRGRRRKGLPLASLIGYTNAGKTTLLNALSGKRDLHTADRLFSTLDPATRAVRLPDGGACLVSDTVGLLHRLPHDLIAAFRATLEEAAFADVLISVFDASSASIDRQIATTDDVITLLGIEDTPRVVVYNKTDAALPDERAMLAARVPDAVLVSALTGEGVGRLKERIQEALHHAAATA